jgi:hypothetical protein
MFPKLTSFLFPKTNDGHGHNMVPSRIDNIQQREVSNENAKGAKQNLNFRISTWYVWMLLGEKILENSTAGSIIAVAINIYWSFRFPPPHVSFPHAGPWIGGVNLLA